MLRVNNAYEILSDPERRAAYDLERTGLVGGHALSRQESTSPRESRGVMVQQDKRVSLIQRIGLFNSVEPAELKPIAQQMTWRVISSSTWAFLSGGCSVRRSLARPTRWPGARVRPWELGGKN